VEGLAITALLVVMLGGLWALARSAPSSEVGDIAGVPRPAISASEGCQAFAEYWLDETSIDVEPTVFEGFTNCRLGMDGRWYVWPESPNNPGLLVPAEMRADAENLRRTLLEQIVAFQQSLPSHLSESLGSVYSERVNPVVGQTREGVPIANVRTRYARMVNAFGLDPGNEALADYVAWAMERRMHAYGVFRRACLDGSTEFLRQPCTGMEDNLSIRYAPWYWELANPLLLDAYLNDVFGGEATAAAG
jgi:hypothetical protein